MNWIWDDLIINYIEWKYLIYLRTLKIRYFWRYKDLDTLYTVLNKLPHLEEIILTRSSMENILGFTTAFGNGWKQIALKASPSNSSSFPYAYKSNASNMHRLLFLNQDTYFHYSFIKMYALNGHNDFVCDLCVNLDLKKI